VAQGEQKGTFLVEERLESSQVMSAL
jgi:hypothetical protein